MNNADLGLTLQSRVCHLYGLVPCKHAREQFKANFNKNYRTIFDDLITKIFDELKSNPVKCTTYEKSLKSGETYIPYNFILDNGKTVSIRTSKSNKMIAPRVVGQAGYDVLNLFFSDIIGEELFTQEQIRRAVYNNISDMLPTFVNYLLNSDYTIWIYPKEEEFDYIVVDNNTAVDIEYKDDFFSFTKLLENWTESITLKYNNISIAEIQTHKNRTFKFRFNFPNLVKLFIEEKTNTETIGITAEKVICEKFNLKYPESFNRRYSKKIACELKPIIDEVFKHLPEAIKHTGSDSGERLGASKCPYDFILKGNKTLSLKTNTGSMVCPPEVGQPNDKTFYLYFKDLIKEDHVDETIFKELVLTKVSDMMPIYVEHLFDSDFLLRLYKKKNKWEYQIHEKFFGSSMLWNCSEFTFTKNKIDLWNESNTVKYKNKRLGEFQFHHHRNCYKFRFDYENLIELINDYMKSIK